MQISISVTTISLLLCTLASSLTITSPSAGDSLDPTQPITVQWTSTSSDPATFNLILDNTNSNSLVKNKQVATSLSTSSGSYILSTAALMTYGTGFVFKAEDSTGNLLSTSGAFDLATGANPGSSSSARVLTLSPSALSSSTSNGGTDTASTAGSSLFAQTTGTDITAAMTTATRLSTATTADTSTTSNGFFTSTTSRSTSGTRSVASSAASATTSANAQPRTGSSSQIVFSAAGILAGLVALLA